MVKKHNQKRRRLAAITLREAERRYGILNSTLCRWVQKGYIPIVLRTKNELFVDEPVLAELAEAYKKNPGQGKKTILMLKGG